MVLVLVLAVLVAVAVVVRRRLIARAGGTFELSVRLRDGRAGRGWVLGIGRYRDEHLECFRIFSLSPRPRRSWARRELDVIGRRAPTRAESVSLFAGHVVVRCRAGGTSRPTEQELAMSPASVLGLQSWLESGPPPAAPRDG